MKTEETQTPTLSPRNRPLTQVSIVILLAVAIGTVLYLKKNEPARSISTVPTSATAPLPRLLELGSVNCIPCKAMAPIIEGLTREYAGKLTVEFIDVWKNKTAAEQYQIEMIPVQIFFDATGKELFRHNGFFAKEDILAKWKELGVTL